MTTALIALLAFTWNSAVNPVDSMEMKKLNLLPESRVMVSGSSNVNTFTCMISHPRQGQFLTENRTESFSVFQGSIQLKVRGFDCGNELMNRDFFQTLNQEEHPDITLKLIGMRGDQSDMGMRIIQGRVEVEIAGVKRQMEMRCTLENLPNGLLRIHGTQNFTFSDFGLVPPRRALGLIKVKDEIDVEFTLVIGEERP